MDLIVDHDFNTRRVKIYLKEERDGKIIIIGQGSEGLITQVIELTDGSQTDIKPLLEMPHHIFEQFMRATEVYFTQKGIKTENEHLLEGKTNAMEKHLEDMRTNFTKVLDALIHKI